MNFLKFIFFDFLLFGISFSNLLHYHYHFKTTPKHKTGLKDGDVVYIYNKAKTTFISTYNFERFSMVSKAKAYGDTDYSKFILQIRPAGIRFEVHSSRGYYLGAINGVLTKTKGS